MVASLNLLQDPFVLNELEKTIGNNAVSPCHDTVLFNQDQSEVQPNLFRVGAPLGMVQKSPAAGG